MAHRIEETGLETFWRVAVQGKANTCELQHTNVGS